MNIQTRAGSTCAESAFHKRRNSDSSRFQWGDSKESQENKFKYLESVELESAFKETAIKQGYKYFLTVTFNHNSRRSDADLSRFIKIVHQRLYGNRFEKRGKYLGLFVAREKQKTNNYKDHYHILIEPSKELNLFDLAYAVIEASRRCNSINDLSEEDIGKITKNYFKEKIRKPSDVHVNLVEIETEEDLARISKYVCKGIKHTKGTSICIRQKQSEYDYFPLNTEAAYDYFQRIFSREQ